MAAAVTEEAAKRATRTELTFIVNLRWLVYWARKKEFGVWLKENQDRVADLSVENMLRERMGISSQNLEEGNKKVEIYSGTKGKLENEWLRWMILMMDYVQALERRTASLYRNRGHFRQAPKVPLGR